MRIQNVRNSQTNETMTKIFDNIFISYNYSY